MYKLVYFPKNYTAPQKYDLFKLIFAYLQSFQYFLQDIVPHFDLGNEENAEIWSKLFVDNANIDEIKENLNTKLIVESVESLLLADNKKD